jgi:hypothetical protein
MTEKHLTHDINSPPPKVTKALAITIDRMLHDYTHEERMFWAMQYATGEFDRAETEGRDLTDYRIAVDETVKSAKKNDTGSPNDE